jgi:DNA-binding response OmpR family regulator
MKKRILIAEDDQQLAWALSDSLTFSGFEVETVADGNQVLDRARTFGPDLVLLDAMLPGRSGFELCGQISQRGRTPVIMLTALDQKVDKLRGLGQGADDYITKPFDFDELLARIWAVLRRARMTVRRLKMGKVIVDLDTLRAMSGRREIHLAEHEMPGLRALRQELGESKHGDRDGEEEDVECGPRERGQSLVLSDGAAALLPLLQAQCVELREHRGDDEEREEHGPEFHASTSCRRNTTKLVTVNALIQSSATTNAAR